MGPRLVLVEGCVVGDMQTVVFDEDRPAAERLQELLKHGRSRFR